MNKKTFYIETLGCQMNKSDSEKIAGSLYNIGYEEVSKPEEALFIYIR